jgi:hypothetical protein
MQPLRPGKNRQLRQSDAQLNVCHTGSIAKQRARRVRPTSCCTACELSRLTWLSVKDCQLQNGFDHQQMTLWAHVIRTTQTKPLSMASSAPTRQLSAKSQALAETRRRVRDALIVLETKDGSRMVDLK